MNGHFKFENDIGGDEQEGEYGNATQTTLGQDEKSIAISIEPAFPEGVDPLDHGQVEAYLKQTFAPLVEKGFKINVYYGDFN